LGDLTYFTLIANLANARSQPSEKAYPEYSVKTDATMTPNQLANAARNLARGLGIPVYIRDGRIYQNGPGFAFLPPNGDPAVAEVLLGQQEEADAANESFTVPKAIGLLLMATPILWFACQMLTFQA
jgi:hypothetical protein